MQRLVIRGRSRGLDLGSYALVSLAQARRRALANRKLARQGGDPLRGKPDSAGIPTLEKAAGKVRDIYSEAWREGGNTARQWWASMRDHVFPHIGAKTVDEVTTALPPIWTSKHVTARKVRQRIGTVMRWAIAQGYRQDDLAGDAITAALAETPHAGPAPGGRFPTARSPPPSPRSGTPMRGSGRGWPSSSSC